MRKTVPITDRDFNIIVAGFEIIIYNSSILITVLLFSLMLNTLFQTFITMLSFVFLKFFSGGYHFNNAIACIIYSSSILILIPLIPHIDGLTILLDFISLIVITILAPVDIDIRTKIPKSFNFLFKLISILIILVELFFIKSQPISIIIFSQSLLLLPIFKGDKSQ